jgi:hypothetical protein
MRARAEREARIEHDVERVGARWLAPGRHDPEIIRDANRLELRLRGAHPILVGHCERLERGHGTAERSRGAAQQRDGIGICTKRRQSRERPPLRIRRVRLAEACRLGVGSRVRVGGVYGQRARLEQRIGPAIGVGAVDVEAHCTKAQVAQSVGPLERSGGRSDNASASPQSRGAGPFGPRLGGRLARCAHAACLRFASRSSR